MRLFKTLVAASAIGIAGVLAFGAATPAQASTDRIVGPLASFSGPTAWVPAHVRDDMKVRIASKPGGGVANEQEALALADEFEFPSLTSRGPLIAKTGAGAGKCLTIVTYTGNTPNVGGESGMQDCDPANPNQQFSWRKITSSVAGTGWTLVGNKGGQELIYGDTLWQTSQSAITDIFPQINSYPAAVADLTAQVVSVDSDEKSAVVSGTGEPGAAIAVEGPSGVVNTTVNPDGTWQVTVPGLAVGENPLKVTQTVGDNVQSKDLTATILASPVVDPMIAGGTGVAAIALLAITMFRRNRQSAQH